MKWNFFLRRKKYRRSVKLPVRYSLAAKAENSLASKNESLLWKVRATIARVIIVLARCRTNS